MDKKPHLVRWEIVCKEKRSGGLGVKNLFWLNKALLSKWCWRFATEKGTLWNEVIRGKYGEREGGWCTLDTRGGYGLGLWKAISTCWPCVSSNLSFEIGNGQRIKFWKDARLENTPLLVSFPSLFALAKEAWVRDYWNDVSSEGGWNPIFTRSFND